MTASLGTGPGIGSGGAVFFDLDGTLIDSAPDLGAAANALRAAHGRPPLPLAHYRALVGRGARGMVSVALPEVVGTDLETACRAEFLDLYAERLTATTTLFDGIPTLLAGLRAARVPWGIVTNKAHRLAEPICRSLDLLAAGAARVLIGGDSTPHAKPHPAPLLAAAAQTGVEPAACVYVGDDARDIQAGRAAGMRTIAAAWGYLGVDQPVAEWNADHVVATPADLHRLLQLPGLP